MPFCSECGKSVAPTAKFCRNCGASQEPDPLPSFAPATPPVVAPVCRSCGSVLQPDEKFCGSCGRAVNSGPAIPVSSPPPGAVPVATAPSAGVLTCRSCGNVITPGDKFCNKCLVLIRDDPSGSAPVIPPAPPIVPAAPGGRFCGNCGTPISTTTKFCGGCGAPVGASFPAGQVVPVPSPVPSAPPHGERVIGVIGNVRKIKMLGASWDTFSLMVTDRRMIFAKLTQERLNAAIAEAQQKAKAEGKGFFETWGDQLIVSFQYANRYEAMSPDAALAETPGNSAIENSTVQAVDLKPVAEKGNVQYGEFRMLISASNGNSEYRIGEDDRYINILRTAYGDKVRLPFGYVRVGGVRIRFF